MSNSKPSFASEAQTCLYGGAALDYILGSSKRLQNFYKLFSPKDGGKLTLKDKANIKQVLQASAIALIEASQALEAAPESNHVQES